MFDFLHSILKWQFLNRIQIDRIFYHQLRDRNGSRKSSHFSSGKQNEGKHAAILSLWVGYSVTVSVLCTHNSHTTMKVEENNPFNIIQR